MQALGLEQGLPATLLQHMRLQLGLAAQAQVQLDSPISCTTPST